MKTWVIHSLYTLLLCVVFFGAFCAVVLPGSGDNFSGGRAILGLGVGILAEFATALIITYLLHRKRDRDHA